MWINKVLYFIVVVYISVLSVLYEDSYIIYGVILLFVVILLMQLSLIFLKNKLQVTYRIVKKKENPRLIQIVVIAKNISKVPLGKVVVRLEEKNSIDNRTKEKRLFFYLDKNTEQRQVISLQGEYSSKVEIRIKDIILYDYLRIFKRKIKGNNQNNSIVEYFWPVLYNYNKIELKNYLNRYHCGNSEEFVDNTYDYEGVRKYVEGDPLNKIHWKLSSRLQELVVKKTEYLSDAKTNVTIDCRWTCNHYLKHREAVISVVYFILYSLLNQKETICVNVVWEDNTTTTKEIISLNEMNAIISQIISRKIVLDELKQNDYNINNIIGRSNYYIATYCVYQLKKELVNKGVTLVITNGSNTSCLNETYNVKLIDYNDLETCLERLVI